MNFSRWALIFSVVLFSTGHWIGGGTMLVLMLWDAAFY